jgi:hypothetical protein
MRRFLSLVFLPVMSLSVLSLPAWAVDPPATGTPPAHAARQTWQQHFTQANLAHDGHLTLEEAKGGYADVARHFDDIDVGHRGYVTQDDIQAWRAARRAAHRLTKPSEDKPVPRSAVQHVYPTVRTIAVADKHTVSASAGSVAVVK